MNDRQLSHLLAVTDRPDLIGTPYVIHEEIGRGGMGVVYSAEDTRLGRQVALKVTTGNDQEARVIAALEHPGIVPVHDAGTLPDGRLYYVMKLVRGEPLDQFAQRQASVAGRIALFLKVCDAIEYAHSRGVIHRDLKPANIMAGAFGEVVILDWGVAKTVSGDAGDVAGTPRYMAPEQSHGVADPRSDIYSLGAVLEAILPDDCPRPLHAIILKAKSPKPEDRYPSASELAADLNRYLDGSAVTAYRESVLERLTRFARRNRTLLLLAGAFTMMRLVLFFWRGR